MTRRNVVPLAQSRHARSWNQFICGVLAVAIEWRSEHKPLKPVEEIHHDIAWDMWRDRVRRGEAGVSG